MSRFKGTKDKRDKILRYIRLLTQLLTYQNVSVYFLEILRIYQNDSVDFLFNQDPCGIDIKERVTIDPKDHFEIEGSRGDANLVMKWPDSRKQATLNIQEIKNVTRDVYTLEDSGTFVPVIGLECRGLEPFRCHTPSTGFSAKSIGGKTFEDIDLSDGGEWCDYDVKKDLSVGIYEVEWLCDIHK